MLEFILLLDFALVSAHTCVRMQYSFHLRSAFGSFCDPCPFTDRVTRDCLKDQNFIVRQTGPMANCLGPRQGKHGDYFSKHFPPSHYQEMCHIYLHMPQQTAKHVSTHTQPSLLWEGMLKAQCRHGTGPHVHSHLAAAICPSTTDCLKCFTMHDVSDLHK
jgi:hypothetical protein